MSPVPARRALAVAIGVVLLWLAIGGFAGTLAGKLRDIETDNNEAFLPKASESAQVLELEKSFTTARTVPAIIVYERAGGITAADKSKVAADTQRFTGIKDVVGAPAAPVPSADGKALQVVVQVAEKRQSEIGTAVKALRTAAQRDSTLAVHVTGPAGLASDFSDVGDSIDVTLLLATVSVVIVILIAVYRSPLLWCVPILAVATGLTIAQGVIYLLGRYGGVTVDAQSSSIFLVLAFGVGTDYALLLIARYREELRKQESRFAALGTALRGTGGSIIASAATVTVSMLCLLLSQLSTNKSLGILAAVGIVCTAAATLTLLPALLLLSGRGLFWPFVPRFGSQAGARDGGWGRVAALINRRGRLGAGLVTLVLVAMAVAVTQLRADGIAQTQAFTHRVDSAVGQQVLDRHYPPGSGSPAVLVARSDRIQAVADAAGMVPGVASVVVDGQPPSSGPGAGRATQPPRSVGGVSRAFATLAAAPDSQRALTTIKQVRSAVHSVPGASARVGGQSAVYLDLQSAGIRDRNVIIPIVLLAIFVILTLLLRALAASLMLLVTVVLSFVATLGVSALVFNHVFHFPGTDASYPLYAFIFLVALGVDYNIFLMTRVQEEAAIRGTRLGTVHALAVTGGVITSAGLVLAATFTTLAVQPLVILATIGFSVAFGVLLDTLVVRSVLVPALTIALGRAAWWPGRLSRRTAVAAPERQEGDRLPAVVHD